MLLCTMQNGKVRDSLYPFNHWAEMANKKKNCLAQGHNTTSHARNEPIILRLHVQSLANSLPVYHIDTLIQIIQWRKGRFTFCIFIYICIPCEVFNTSKFLLENPSSLHDWILPTPTVKCFCTSAHNKCLHFCSTECFCVVTFQALCMSLPQAWFHHVLMLGPTQSQDIKV